MTIFFTGCTHFDHANIIKLANRPFSDFDEMNETLIKNWNSVVGHWDTVYHLGDVGYFQDRERATQTIGRLRGFKHLVRGNHDPLYVSNNAQWESVNSYLELSPNKHKLVLFHYPIEDWNGRYKGSIHLHCHTHSSQFFNPSIPAGANFGHINRFNVGVDACNFTPISLDEILKAAEA